MPAVQVKNKIFIMKIYKMNFNGWFMQKCEDKENMLCKDSKKIGWAQKKSRWEYQFKAI